MEFQYGGAFLPATRFFSEASVDIQYHHTESQPEMEFYNVIIWTTTCVCLPLTTLVIFCVCCAVRKEQVPVIYYTNLLISNIIQFSIIIFFKCNPQPGQTSYGIIGIYAVGLMVSLYFKTSIAIERCFVIACPQSNWIRQTGGSILVSVLVWILCVTTVSLSLVFHEIITFSVLSLLPGPLFIFFSAWTFKALPAATSVPADEKRRIVANLVLLFINYFLMILPTIICFIVTIVSFYTIPIVVLYITFVLFLLSPFADLILFFFMQKGTFDKLLSCLCCCIMDNSAADVAGHQQLHELMLQREKEREKANHTV